MQKTKSTKGLDKVILYLDYTVRYLRVFRIITYTFLPLFFYFAVIVLLEHINIILPMWAIVTVFIIIYLGCLAECFRIILDDLTDFRFDEYLEVVKAGVRK